ncbi:hypothetical protein L210DRAFT_3587718 [Boletus edulis BED1]|uniref:Secreted protein n=1 Tax=Boletus edulis BED1 TaxID=1328754 RepID=A0AAD4BAA7_BOLED|nr:hypothetical protein L210DRAFT_3587718 [Boletus edulis BED1]
MILHRNFSAQHCLAWRLLFTTATGANPPNTCIRASGVPPRVMFRIALHQAYKNLSGDFHRHKATLHSLVFPPSARPSTHTTCSSLTLTASLVYSMAVPPIYLHSNPPSNPAFHSICQA